MRKNDKFYEINETVVVNKMYFRKTLIVLHMYTTRLKAL